MSTWSKELPKEDGFYWFRNDWFGGKPFVVQWWAAGKEVLVAGTECSINADSTDPLGTTISNTNGEFWTTPLSAPPQ